MKFNIKKFLVATLVIISQIAYPMVIQQYPISLSVKPNIILTFDDSGSMSRNYIPDTPSPSLTTESAMSYYYNPLYYNPNVVYKPWVKTKTSTGLTYYPQAPLSIINSTTTNSNNVFTSGDTLLQGVSYTVTYDCSSNNWDNTRNYTNGNKFSSNGGGGQTLCNSLSGTTYTMTQDYQVKSGQTWVPASSSGGSGTTYNAVYYMLATSAVVAGSSLPVCGANDCFTAPTCTATSSCAVPPTLPSGVTYKLKKYTIASTDTVGLQNFANWKQYAYSRQNMVSHALSEVISSLVGVNIGFQPFNSTSTTNNNTKAVDSTVTAHTLSGSSYYSSSGRMYNMDNPADVTILLDLIYNTESNSATPTRTTLLKVGNQFKSNTLTLTSTNDDGTSFAPSTKGIIQYACQKNAAFIITDGYTNETPSLTMPAYDSGSNDQTYATKQPYWNTSSSKSQFSTSLADISLRFYTNNLRSDLSLGQVPIDKFTAGNADLNKNLHMNTYAITLGANGNIFGKTNFTNQTNDPYTYPPTWVDPTGATNNPDQIDDLWHSTINGRGVMFTSGDPASLATQLQSVISDIVTRAANRDSIAVANNYITNANNAYYVPSYTSSTTGDVTKYTINLSGSTPTVNATPVWSAYTQLALQIAGTTARKMVTLNSSGVGVSVASNSTLRTTQLGSLINASPVVIQNGSSTIVYQAANDGMLHAIDASTGNELWAYAPSFLVGQTPTGTNQYVLDGTPAYGYANGKTYLIGGSGFNTAHNGYYAVDITTPATTATTEATVASGIKWEFPVNPNITAANQALYQKNMGTGTSRPMIINTKAFGTVVAISSGYNNGTGTIGGAVQTGGDGKGHVWLLDPATGAVKAEMVTPNGSSTAPIGMASLVGFILNPRSDTNVTALYGGDALGNIWKFNTSEVNPSNWSGTNTAKVSTIATLTDKNGLAQPVTSSPMVSANASTNNAIVYVATGQLFSSTDISSPVVNSFYGIEDTGTVATRSNLLQLTSTSSGVTFPSTISKTLALNYKHGWFFDFNETGERALARVSVSSGIISFTTNVITTNACVSASYSYTFTIPKALITNNDGSGITPTWKIEFKQSDTTSTNPSSTNKTFDGGVRVEITKDISNPIVVFIKGIIYTLSANGTLTQVGTYTSGRQMGTWREIIRK